MPSISRQYKDVLSRNPAGPHGLSTHGEGMDALVEATQDAVARWVESAKRGGISLGLLSLWPHKEKVTRPPQEDESSRLCLIAQKDIAISVLAKARLSASGARA
ncbi:MAG: hypothetical protein ABI379_06100 [Rhodanobacter sp.]